jgi:hypothetical protein
MKATTVKENHRLEQRGPTGINQPRKMETSNPTRKEDQCQFKINIRLNLEDDSFYLSNKGLYPWWSSSDLHHLKNHGYARHPDLHYNHMVKVADVVVKMVWWNADSQACYNCAHILISPVICLTIKAFIIDKTKQNKWSSRLTKTI